MAKSQIRSPLERIRWMEAVACAGPGEPAMRVAAFMSNRVNAKTGEISYSRQTISDGLNMSLSAVKRGLAELRRQQFIRSTKQQFRGTSVYRLTFPNGSQTEPIANGPQSEPIGEATTGSLQGPIGDSPIGPQIGPPYNRDSELGRLEGCPQGDPSAEPSYQYCADPFDPDDPGPTHLDDYLNDEPVNSGRA